MFCIGKLAISSNVIVLYGCFFDRAGTLFPVYVSNGQGGSAKIVEYFICKPLGGGYLAIMAHFRRFSGDSLAILWRFLAILRYPACQGENRGLFYPSLVFTLRRCRSSQQNNDFWLSGCFSEACRQAPVLRDLPQQGAVKAFLAL